MSSRFNPTRMTNLAVHADSPERISIECHYAGARYHIWLHPDTRAPTEPLFKNPPRGTPHRSAADFPTRRLGLTTAFGAAMLAAMLAKMEADNLLDAALAVCAEREKQREHDLLMAARFDLVISAPDPSGRVLFVTDANSLSEDIHDAATFPYNAMQETSQARAIANHAPGTPFHASIPLAVISLTRRELADFGVNV